MDWEQTEPYPGFRRPTRGSWKVPLCAMPLVVFDVRTSRSSDCETREPDSSDDSETGTSSTPKRISPHAGRIGATESRPQALHRRRSPVV